MIRLTFYAGKPMASANPVTNHHRAEQLSDWENKVGRAFNGFTKFDAVGWWQGEVEQSVVYEILFSEHAFPTWEFMAKQAKLSLAETLDQQEVLVVWTEMGGLL